MAVAGSGAELGISPITDPHPPRAKYSAKPGNVPDLFSHHYRSHPVHRQALWPGLDDERGVDVGGRAVLDQRSPGRFREWAASRKTPAGLHDRATIGDSVCMNMHDRLKLRMPAHAADSAAALRTGLPGYQAERVAVGVLIHAPPHHVPARAWTWGAVLADIARARGGHPLMGSIKVADQDVEVRARHRPRARGAAKDL
jgi:hypothetical protein